MLKRPALSIALCVAIAATPACFVRHRIVRSPAARQTAPMQAATKDQLIERLHAISDPIHSFTMRADLSPSVLNPSKGTATDYATVSAYILFRKPDDIRVLAKDPMIGTTILDMVSNGNQFRVSIPPKKQFIVGSNNAPESSGNKLENLRPAALLTSLMIYPPDPETDATLFENDSQRALYILVIIRRSHNQLALAREVYFDGRTLEVSRQKTFDASGNIVSDARYSEWQPYDGVSFPSQIDIQRPKENYEVQLSVVTLQLNSPDLTAAKFSLPQPPDTRLKVLK